MHSDISDLKQAESELVRLAYDDPLTELPNRKAFYEQLRGVLAQAERAEEHFAAAVDCGHPATSSGSRRKPI